MPANILSVQIDPFRDPADPVTGQVQVVCTVAATIPVDIGGGQTLREVSGLIFIDPTLTDAEVDAEVAAAGAAMMNANTLGSFTAADVRRFYG